MSHHTTTHWGPIHVGKRFAVIRYVEGRSEFWGGTNLKTKLPFVLYTREACEAECKRLNNLEKVA